MLRFAGPTAELLLLSSTDFGETWGPVRNLTSPAITNFNLAPIFQHGMVWYGMVHHGMVWYGMVCVCMGEVREGELVPMVPSIAI